MPSATAANEIEKTTWTALLLKPGVTETTAIKSTDGRVQRHEVKVGSRRIGVLVVGPPRRAPPRWLARFTPFAPALSALVNTSVSAVLLVPVGDRLFALTLGYGRALLADDMCEDGFGLKVALNAVPAASVKAIDRSSFDAFAHQTRTQGIRAGKLAQLGLDTDLDILRALTGTPDDAAVGAKLTGKDALSFSARVAVEDLPAQLGRYLTLASSERFREEHGELDRIDEVSRADLRDRLDARLLAKLRTDDLDGVWLAVPDLVDWERVGFRYGTGAHELHADVDLADLMKEVHGQSRMTIASRRVHEIELDSGAESRRWPLRKCIHAEVILDGHTYVVSHGSWYRIANDLVAQVDEAVRQLERATTLPDYCDAAEGPYNQRVASERGHQLFDRLGVNVGGAHSQIEPCDLFTRKRELIHVKRFGSAAVISHLFAQGAVSGDLLYESHDFRKKMRAAASAGFRTLIPQHRVEPDRYTIVYGIIVPPGGRTSGLPFFSRLNLHRAAKRLTRIGYRVAVEWVPNRNPR